MKRRSSSSIRGNLSIISIVKSTGLLWEEEWGLESEVAEEHAKEEGSCSRTEEVEKIPWTEQDFTSIWWVQKQSLLIQHRIC